MPLALSHSITKCRLCGSSALEKILNLGRQPPANSLRPCLSEAAPTVPLVLCRCDACGVVQLTETIASEFLFSHYVWVTGTSKGAQDYSRRFCDEILKRVDGSAHSVVEIASNDGTFLKPFLARRLKVLGIDPARNIAEKATKNGIPTLAEFFGLACASNVVERQGKADVVFARNVLPHVPDPRDVICGMAACLSQEGVGAIEFHRADMIVRELHYDSIYHEHIFYYTLRDVESILTGAGLAAFDVAESPISGGSWVVYFAKGQRPVSQKLTDARKNEEDLELHKAEGWNEFSRRCLIHRKKFLGLLRAKRASGASIVGYGASARSSTLLNYCGIGPKDLNSVADKSSYKQGKYTPGSNLLIEAPEVVFKNKPDSVVLLAWNFKNEILEDIEQAFGWRGPVLVPLPSEPEWIRDP